MKDNYFVDEFNCLVIKRKGEKIIPKGNWLIKDNNLIYVLDEKLNWRRKYNLPKQLAFCGRWSLNKDHNLVFTLKENKRQFQNQKLILKAELLDTRYDALIFLLNTKQKNEKEEIRSFQLKGRWQQDKYNRIQFFIKRNKTDYDVLTFGGIWEVLDNTLVYTYTKTYLKRKEKIQKTLTFKGYWQINQKNKLNYILSLENNSLFSFMVKLETTNIRAEDKEIRFSVGIGVGKNFKEKTFIISGDWKIDKNLGIYFEVEQKENRINQIIFGADVEFSNDKVSFKLKNNKGDNLGIVVIFSHNFIKKTANWFLEFIKENKEFEIKAGINIFW